MVLYYGTLKQLITNQQTKMKIDECWREIVGFICGDPMTISG